MKKKNSSNYTKKDLSHVFNSFAKRSVKDFPELEGNFILYSVITGNDYTNIRDQAVIDDIYSEIEFKLDYDNSGSVAFALKADNYNIIVHNLLLKNRTMTSFKDSYNQEIEAILEHELGHLVAPAGDSQDHSNNFCECVADSFSFIRMQKKYKNISKSIEATAWISAENFIFGDERLHFTAHVLTELGLILEKNNIPELSPLESANMAYRISLKYAVSQEKLERLASIFEPVRAADMLDKNLSLRICAKIMLNDHGDLSKDVFSICKTFLKPFLNKDKDILATLFPRKYIDNIKLDDAVWNEVQKKIEIEERNNKAIKINSELDYLDILGAFDENKLDIINPAKYEGDNSIKHIKLAKLKHLRKAA